MSKPTRIERRLLNWYAFWSLFALAAAVMGFMEAGEGFSDGSGGWGDLIFGLFNLLWGLSWWGDRRVVKARKRWSDWGDLTVKSFDEHVAKKRAKIEGRLR